MNNLKGYVFNKFYILNNQDCVDYLDQNLFEDSREFEQGFQILAVLKNENVYSVDILKRIPTYLFDFDDKSKSLNKKESFLFKQINFQIDLTDYTIKTLGGAINNNDVKLFIKRKLKNLVVSPIEFDIKFVYDNLTSNDFEVNIKSLSIRNFNYKNGLVGKFSGQIIDKSIVDEIFLNYKSDILKAVFIIAFNSYEFDMQIFPNGAIKILTNSDNQHNTLEDIKKYLIIE